MKMRGPGFECPFAGGRSKANLVTPLASRSGQNTDERAAKRSVHRHDLKAGDGGVVAVTRRER